jgi:HEAT repeat protein
LGAARPACLRASSEPGATMVADAALGRLRRRGLEPELAARLLEGLPGIAHPQLVPVVRPYLRHRDPEVKKRAIACLAAAGPGAAAWILPSLGDEDLTIARQALSALTRVRAVGIAGEVARWLDGRNMNLKKAAAEALATIGDRTVLPTLLHWLETHDNPGFRELLLGAVSFSVGDALVGVLADRLDDAAEPRGRDLLLDALEHRLSAEQIAGLVHLRSEGWTTALLRKAYGGDWALAGGTLTELDHALAVRGLADRIPAPDTLEGEGAEAFAALRAGARLRRALRDEAEVGPLLAQANVAGQLRLPSLSPSDVHRILDAYPGLDEAARRGALQVLSGGELDAVARLRVARLLERADTKHAPGELVRHVAATSTVQCAVQLQHWTDSRVHEAATRTLLLAGAAEPNAWPERDAARLLEQLVRQGALKPAFDWSLPRQQLPALYRALAHRFGKGFAAARLGEWLQQDAALLPEIFPELVRLELAATRELERLARSSSTNVDVREKALTELSRRRSSELHALASELLEDSHVALRERAALVLLELGDSRDRERALSAYLAGAFRERFYLSLTHADLPLLERAMSSPAKSRRPLVRLLEKFQDARRTPLLIEAWRTSQDEARVEARDALRRQDGALIWPHLKALLEQGTTAPLELIGRLDAIPESLVALLRESSDRDEWYAFIARVSGPGLLHAPGLAAVSSETLPEAAPGLSLLLRLDDWSSRTGVEKLADTLAPLLRAGTRETSLTTIVEASTVLAGPLRVTLLARLGSPTDEIVVGALLDAVLELPRLREELPAPLLAAVERRMTREFDGAPERARLILSYRASRAGTDEEARRSLVDQLEKSLAHSASRVRSHALRLLREHAPRARYLEATQGLLHDRDPSTVRSAIRILGFGRQISAIPGIAEHLGHPQAVVRDAARDALLHLGQDALPALRHAVGQARPDRRAALQRVLADVEHGIEAEEVPE